MNFKHSGFPTPQTSVSCFFSGSLSSHKNASGSPKGLIFCPLLVSRYEQLEQELERFYEQQLGCGKNGQTDESRMLGADLKLEPACHVDLLGQWLNFKLFGITYLVGKISRSNFFFRVQKVCKYKSTWNLLDKLFKDRLDQQIPAKKGHEFGVSRKISKKS